MKNISLPIISLTIFSAVVVITAIFAFTFFSKGTQQHITQFWSNYDDNSTIHVNHQLWDEFLEEYVIEDDTSGIHLVNYSAVTQAPKLLKSYITLLSTIDPRQLTRNEQKAYWINLYNALTIQLIVEHYPTSSITKLGSRLTSFGPWDDMVITLAQQALSLNHIEHAILRPLWQDPRIHFAVNCASIGCPNLQLEAFNVDNIDELLDDAADAFINHPRGVHFTNKELILSSIFDWYSSDFGQTSKDKLQWISQYLYGEKAEQLLNFDGDIRYEYDWDLNEFK